MTPRPMSLQLPHVPPRHALHVSDQSQPERIHLTSSSVTSRSTQTTLGFTSNCTHSKHDVRPSSPIHPCAQRPRLQHHPRQRPRAHAAHRPPGRHSRSDADLNRTRDDPVCARRERGTQGREYWTEGNELVPGCEFRGGAAEGAVDFVAERVSLELVLGAEERRGGLERFLWWGL